MKNKFKFYFTKIFDQVFSCLWVMFSICKVKILVLPSVDEMIK